MNDFAPITEDRPRFGAILITANGNVFRMRELESLDTEKSENGDAGTWSLVAPLALNADAARVIAPMDIIALYGYRASTDVAGRTTPTLDPLPDFKRLDAQTTYGSPNAAVIKYLGTDRCLMIGMVDAAEEDYDYEGSRRTFSVHGRDLTKVFIDNDTLVPSTIPEGGDKGAFAGLSNIVLHRDTSGTQLLKNILDCFVAKDPQRINELVAAAGSSLFTPAEGKILTKYGYPWRSFVRDDRLIDGFESLGNGQFPTYAVQSGSAWTNVVELRNFPITRLYVNEIGELIYDDTWTAWGFGSATGSVIQEPPRRLYAGDVRRATFRQADDDVVTALSIMSPLSQAADTGLAGIATFGKQHVGSSGALKRFGYRYQSFVSQYDPIDAYTKTATGGDTKDPTRNLLNARFPILWTLHNDIWFGTLTVKGNAYWRVGQRLFTDIGGVQTATQPLTGGYKFWYIRSVRHSLRWGSDWVTTLDVRFPRDS